MNMHFGGDSVTLVRTFVYAAAWRGGDACGAEACHATLEGALHGRPWPISSLSLLGGCTQDTNTLRTPNGGPFVLTLFCGQVSPKGQTFILFCSSHTPSPCGGWQATRVEGSWQLCLQICSLFLACLGLKYADHGCMFCPFRME